VNREWCSEQNLTSRKLERWYWMRCVSRPGEDKRFEVAHADGVDALAIHDLKNGKRPDYHGWDEAKLAKHVAILRLQMRQGMTDDEYATWAQREIAL